MDFYEVTGGEYTGVATESISCASKVCLGVDLFGFILFGTLSASWIWMSVSFPSLGRKYKKNENDKNFLPSKPV